MAFRQGGKPANMVQLHCFSFIKSEWGFFPKFRTFGKLVCLLVGWFLQSFHVLLLIFIIFKEKEAKKVLFHVDVDIISQSKMTLVQDELKLKEVSVLVLPLVPSTWTYWRYFTVRKCIYRSALRSIKAILQLTDVTGRAPDLY